MKQTFHFDGQDYEISDEAWNRFIDAYKEIVAELVAQWVAEKIAEDIPEEGQQ